MEKALAEWSKKTQCPDFDYFPNGGIQNFWCHRPDHLTVASVHALAGVDIFTKGPHANDTLTLDAANDFGRYNPAFVRWLVDHAGPSERDSVARKATQAAYDATMKPLAEIFWKTYGKARADQACFAREKATYADLITRKRLPKDYYEKWFFFMNPYFCDGRPKAQNFFYDNAFDAGVDGNVTKTVIGFWLRRSIDGTMETFAEGLKKLVAAYEPELITTTPTRFADPATLTRAIDAGVNGANSGCKDPKSAAGSASISITVSPDGHLAARVMTARPPVSPAQSTCIENKISSQQVPAFDGESLLFNRSVALK